MDKVRILIIDDERIILKAYTKELEAMGYEVHSAMSGQEAIEILQRESFDIAFTDLVMPGMNGVEICKKIKEMYPETEVVLISGYPEEVVEHQMNFVEAGGREEWLSERGGYKYAV